MMLPMYLSYAAFLFWSGTVFVTTKDINYTPPVKAAAAYIQVDKDHQGRT